MQLNWSAKNSVLTQRMAEFSYEDVIARILSKNRWASEGELAEALGISRNTWTAYKKGKTSFGLNQITDICAVLGVTSQWLLYGDELQTPSQTLSRMPAGSVMIPRFDVRAAAGAGSLALTEDVSSYFAFERAWLQRALPRWAGPNSVVGILEGSGDSMEPTIRDGDLIMAVREPPEWAVDAGGIFVVLHHGQLRIKRLQVDMRSGDVTLISDNTRYAPETVARDRLEFDLNVLAQVFFSGGRLRGPS